MKTQREIAAIAAATLVASAFAAFAGGARTRVFGEVSAAFGREVMTREIGERVEPSEGVTPVAISLLPALEAPGGMWSVYGLRVNLLAGRHRDIAGFDIGLLGNITSEEFDGVQAAGLWNSIGNSDGAVQIAGVLNRCEVNFYGLQAAGLVNVADGLCEGLQISFVNRAASLSGLQVGLYNNIDCGSGLQIGVINSARSLEGLQIGVINIISDSTIPFFPVINFAI